MAQENTPEVNQELERLYEFLYVAPVALIEFDSDGQVKMANPRVAQLFNRFAAGGYFANFFAFLDDILPALKDAIVSFEEERGQIMESRRFSIDVPDADTGETLWMDVTVMRQEKDKFYASFRNWAKRSPVNRPFSRLNKG